MNKLITVSLLLLFVACQTKSNPEIFKEKVKPLPFSAKELLDPLPRTQYAGDSLQYTAFPMGGIGSGCISLGGNGKLTDWEIFNKPNKGYRPYFSFLSAWAQKEGEKPVFKVLEGPLTQRLDGPTYIPDDLKKPYWQDENGIGPTRKHGSTLPRMRNCSFDGKFPFAEVSLEDPNFPLETKVEGWSPFIPNNSKESSLPVAILNVTFKNITKKTVSAVLAANLQNKAGDHNRMIREKGANIMYLTEDKEDTGKAMFVATPASVTTWQTQWPKGNWWDDLIHFTNTFVKTGAFDTTSSESFDGVLKEAPQEAKTENSKVASIGTPITLKPGESITVPIIYGWYFPDADWGKNYYAKQWESGYEVAKHVLSNLERLEKETRLFQTSLFDSKLPGVVLEAISTQLSILRSTTLIRFEDGTLYGWEGTTHRRRLGPGTCNHVWNYQQVIPYLFPDLQRSIIENFLTVGQKENGFIDFRIPAKPGVTSDFNKSAADGQMGQVCWVYREFLVSGDLLWLKKWWPKTKKMLEYAWVDWDKDKDGLMEGSHHNTLDLNFRSPETMCGSMYQAALLAGERMAIIVDDTDAAKKYREVFEKGKELSDKHMFNGQYYRQMPLDSGVSDKYQLLNGSISEQVGGQLYARMLGLEDIYDRENLNKAIGNIFKYNYKEDFYDFVNAFRAYTVGNEKGVLIATWPNDDRPEYPLLYCDETQVGYEYQVAGNLLYEGYILEGLTVTKSIRDRFDGEKRNPFCEFEYGNHYVRSMANYNQLLALSGFRYNGYEKRLRLAPVLNENDFNTFFSVEGAWGNIIQKIDETRQLVTIDVKSGALSLKQLNLMANKSAVHASVLFNGKEYKAKIGPARNEAWDSDKMVTILLNDKLVINKGDEFSVILNK